MKDRPRFGVANAASGTAKVSLDAVEDELRSGPPVDDRRLLDVVCCLKSEVSDSPLQLGIDRILNAVLEAAYAEKAHPDAYVVDKAHQLAGRVSGL